MYKARRIRFLVFSWLFLTPEHAGRRVAARVPCSGPIDVRIHYHTDNYWFSGSESTLMVLLAATLEQPALEAEFTYRAWPEYERGLRGKLDPRVRARRLRLPDPANLKAALSRGRSPRVARVLRGGVSLMPIRQLCLVWDIGRMYAELIRSDPDVVHINNGGFPGAISCNATAIAARIAGIPALYVVNNIAYPYRTPGRLIDYPVDRFVASSVDLFVTGSNAAASALRGVLRLAPARQRVIPNAVVRREPRSTVAETRHALGVATDQRIMLVVARLEERKGHRYLFDAMTRLPSSCDDVVLVVAGDGPERASLEALVESEHLAHRIRLLGEHDDPWALYATADVVVLPSIGHEDFPIVILEAMAAGRPVVATRVAGAPDQVVDGVTGHIVEPRDAAALAVAITDVLETPGRGEQMGIAGRERYDEQFAPERVVDAYVDAYRTLGTRDHLRRKNPPLRRIADEPS
jgi:L-malate glycosyltransferase